MFLNAGTLTKLAEIGLELRRLLYPMPTGIGWSGKMRGVDWIAKTEKEYELPFE
jgi:hypothetical protein